MILQDARLPLGSQCRCDVLPFLLCQHDPSKVFIHCVVVVKHARVLGSYLHGLAEYGPGFAVYGMAMGSSLDVGTGLVDGGVCGAISL